MAAMYELIDMTTFELVGAYDDFREIARILVYDLEHNGADSVRSLELFYGNKDMPEGSIDRESLLSLAQRLQAEAIQSNKIA